MVVMKKPAAASRGSQSGRPEAPAPAPAVGVMLPAAPPTAPPDWYTEPDDKAQLMVYLVTAAKLVNEEDLEADPPLRDPAMIGKGEFHAAVVDSLANPVSIGPGRKRSKEVELDTYLGVMEGPAAAGHHHAGLRFHKPFPSRIPRRQSWTSVPCFKDRRSGHRLLRLSTTDILL